MYPGWLLGTALLIAIYCLLIFIWQVVNCLDKRNDSTLPKLYLIFLVKNQESTIEGLVRRVFAAAYSRPVELIIVDTGSTDKTKKILERLSVKCDVLKFVPSSEVQLSKKLQNLCHGNVVYCFDLTSSISYSLLAKTIDSILINSKVTSLYRTRVLSRNDTLV